MTATAHLYLDKVHRDLEDAGEAMRILWGRSDVDTLGPLVDVRTALEAQTRALASLALAVESLAKAQP